MRNWRRGRFLPMALANSPPLRRGFFCNALEHSSHIRIRMLSGGCPATQPNGSAVPFPREWRSLLFHVTLDLRDS
jgi:hypothetical protein